MRLTAEEKHDNLWKQVIADTDHGSFPSALKMPGLFVESMKPTFDTAGDLMPSGILGRRVKYIHSVGVVGKVKFAANDASTYSGIFKGASKGLIRLSAAVEPGFN